MFIIILFIYHRLIEFGISHFIYDEFYPPKLNSSYRIIVSLKLIEGQSKIYTLILCSQEIVHLVILRIITELKK